MSEYFDWASAISYNADVTIAISTRGFGKTYGLRVAAIKDWLRDGSRFVEVSRYKDEAKRVSKGYFDKIQENQEFPGLIFETTSELAYVARKPAEGEKPDWQVIGYFATMTVAQTIKRQTFARVKKIIMDEAIVDKRISPYYRYLPHEYDTLINIVDTVTRERADDATRTRPHVYLLGNSVDLVNPYFEAFGITAPPRHGTTWYADKTALLVYPEGGKYADSKATGTLAGRLASRTEEGKTAIDNEFHVGGDGLIARKPARATYVWGIRYKGRNYGVWADSYAGAVYVSPKVPADAKLMALTRDDETADVRVAKKAEPALKSLVELYHAGVLRYESPSTREGILDALALYGLR